MEVGAFEFRSRRGAIAIGLPQQSAGSVSDESEDSEFEDEDVCYGSSLCDDKPSSTPPPRTPRYPDLLVGTAQRRALRMTGGSLARGSFGFSVR